MEAHIQEMVSADVIWEDSLVSLGKTFYNTDAQEYVKMHTFYNTDAREHVKMHTFYNTDAQEHVKMHTFYNTDAQEHQKNAYIL